jgi:hypothetical protein
MQWGKVRREHGAPGCRAQRQLGIAAILMLSLAASGCSTDIGGMSSSSNTIPQASPVSAGPDDSPEAAGIYRAEPETQPASAEAPKPQRQPAKPTAQRNNFVDIYAYAPAK